MAHITVDTNAGENTLFDKLVQLRGDSQTRRERLDLGDIKVTLENGKVLLLERKSWSDWVSSLRDGRYKNQKARLLSHRDTSEGNVSLFYILETPAVPTHAGTTAGMPNSQAFAALMKTQLRDNIVVLWASSSEDIAHQVAYIADTYERGGFQQSTQIAASGYAGVVQHSKKRKNAEEDQFAIMLSSMPGVSARKAHVITKAYATPAALVHAYQALASDKLRDKMLEDLIDGDKRLGPSI
jgi:ERCC4-type nuclease